MVFSKKNYDDISKSLEEEFQSYRAGDIIVSILDIEKPISLFGTHESQIHHGAIQFPWYRRQLQKSYNQTLVTTEKNVANKKKTPKTSTVKEERKWFQFWRKQ